jgi:glutathione reductase (NADPH)
VDAYAAKGIRFVFNDVFTRIEKAAHGLVAQTKAGATLEADQIMFAIGRSPNTTRLGLEHAGVVLKANGAVSVDANNRTNIAHIHAVGDVTDRVPLTPVAIREGHAVADNLFGGKSRVVDYRAIPTAVFSTPELGTVGLTEAEAREKHAVVDLYRTSFRPMKQTLSGGTQKTMMKLLVDGLTDKVLGCHILGEDAGEIVQAVAIAIRMGATKADFDETMALHPSAAEELVTMRTRTARFEK